MKWMKQESCKALNISCSDYAKEKKMKKVPELQVESGNKIRD